MPILPTPASILRRGVTRFFRGLREGDQRTLLTGAAIAAVGFLRRSDSERTLIHTQELEDGQSVVVRRTSPDAIRLEIRDPSD
jgi:hypothetical protein